MLLRGIHTISTLAISMASTIVIGSCGPAATGELPAESSDAGGPEIRLPPRDESYDCQDVPEVGECRDQVAVYCDRRSAAIVEKRCGARGLSCADDGNLGARCVNESGEEEEVPVEPADPDGPPIEEPDPDTTEAGCGDVTFEGQCDGNTLSFCLYGYLFSSECGENSKVCGYNESSQFYACLGTSSSCEELSGIGECSPDGTQVFYCNSSDEIRGYSCGENQECQFAGFFFDCVDTAIPVSYP